MTSYLSAFRDKLSDIADQMHGLAEKRTLPLWIRSSLSRIAGAFDIYAEMSSISDLRYLNRAAREFREFRRFQAVALGLIPRSRKMDINLARRCCLARRGGRAEVMAAKQEYEESEYGKELAA